MGSRHSRVVVVGSINLDFVVLAPRLPAPGETVLGGTLQRHPGGKGANQAVAAARAGAPVHMIGAVGDDAEGRIGLEALHTEGVDVSGVRVASGPSGIAIIAVAPGGENQIVVAPGANEQVGLDDVDAALRELDLARGDVLLASLEVPMPAVQHAVMAARDTGMAAIVNPAPAAALPDEVLRSRPILTPNRGELAQLTGEPDVVRAARSLLAQGASAVVVTLGERGCALFRDGQQLTIPPYPVEEVVDTTGAGDAFNGVLAAWLAAGKDLERAVRAANLGAALSIRSTGARAGMPSEQEVRRALSG